MTTSSQPSSTGALNVAWCRAIVDQLAQAGLAHAVICPGSRSAAMATALRAAELKLFVQTDERSAAFFALGLAKRTGLATAICTTSGSAVANVVPALAEAYATGTPLVILSCDRPRRGRGSGMPQTMKQVAICAPLVIGQVDLEDPTDDAGRRDALREAIRHLAECLGSGNVTGPIQINIPLLGDQSSIEDEPAELDMDAVPPIGERRRMRLGLSGKSAVASFDPPANSSGIIVCGPDWSAAMSAADLSRLVRGTGYPVLADAPGSARGLGLPGVLAEGDLLVLHPMLAGPAELMIRIGGAPVAHTTQAYASRAKRIVRIEREPVAQDFLAPSFDLLTRPDADAIDALIAAVAPAPAGWCEMWQDLAAGHRQRMVEAIADAEWSELQVAALAIDHAGFPLLHVANSLSIRLANLLVPALPDGRLVFANRGVSGIDGTIGTFLGEAAASDGAALLLTGDLAALHDVPALEACLHRRLRSTILVMNNGGAGLFDLLPLREAPDYDRLVRNDIEIRFDGIARSFGLAYHCCANAQALRTALDAAARSEDATLIEAVMPKGRVESVLPAFFRKVLTDD